MTTALLWAGKPAKVQTLINEYRHHDGFDTVTLGPLALSLMRTVVLCDSDLDNEDREVLRAFDKVNRLSIVDFEDAAPAVRERFSKRVNQLLDGMDLLIEAKDSDSRLSIYGDEKNGVIRNCILFDPDGTLICISGKVFLDKLMDAVHD